jgi:hypothetical protein
MNVKHDFDIRRNSVNQNINESNIEDELDRSFNEKVSGTNLDFTTLVIESNEFIREEIEKLPNYV